MDRSVLLSAALAAFLWYTLPKLLKKVKGKPRHTIHEKKWKQGIVYLYQMAGTKSMSSASPFCIKVETFLRLHKIPFERRNVLLARGENGKVPFIELNGEQTADSTLIITKLAEHFKVQGYESEEDANVGNAICSMVDFRTFNLFVHYKTTCSQQIFMEAMFGGFFPDFVVEWLGPIMSYHLRNMMHRRVNETIGKFTNEQFDELARKDLEVYRGLIGEKKFLFGDRMTTADCALFGHLSATFYLGQDSLPMHTLASERFEPLARYIERIRDDLFGDEFCV
ncbi:hypothetical protein PMAYCL1PPCAC_15332 [Pristionchus mayeri]|uniref:Glutathione S-transferase n=1 Tax=Pristionchus mayeri TaxID=1317129 RepID=A0AAN5CIN8_9BILA|nr:hypothetical protein PMAYCL1PPCAC_15332 [Pristionchus mayeri]